jgi:hypothetical protein
VTTLPAPPVLRHEHDIGWVTAAPLWHGLIGGADPTPEQLASIHRPALLRLESDDFMTELSNRLADPKASLEELVARPKTYRPGPPGATSPRAIDHIKLFQPVHGHFNLIAATLVCRIPGLPDRTVDPASKDEVGFVLRRLSEEQEYAWTTEGWTALSAPDALAKSEELLPMFPIVHPVPDNRRRRLFVGLIPTASTASAKDGGPSPLAATSPGVGTPPDHRLEELDTKVIHPLGQMTGKGGADNAADQEAFLKLSKEQRQQASRFVLLDFADLLARYIPLLWAALAANQRPASGPVRDAYDLLISTSAGGNNLSWREATLTVWGEREAIWGETSQPAKTAVDMSATAMDPTNLRTKISQAWPTTSPPLTPDFPAPKLDPRPTARYVIRCIYRRPCCGPLRPDVASAPSTPFAIASFFDLDAPARPVQITLPIDTSIAGLRKAPRNVSVLVSRELREQMERLTNAKKVLKGEIESPDGVDLGQICSFSLPIITICALIVLMIFVFLLNLVFWWVPFFRICFPLQLKASE